ncbi:MAG: tyrosine-type recombinase/integrase [Actinobacteria bacterium]|nr:tyrosine-type recombinase/integrase [Actinomycetota bacterium]
MPADLVTYSFASQLIDTYLSTLRSPASRATMRASLDAVARLLGEISGVDLDASGGGPGDRIDWAAMTFERAVRIRAAALDRWSPATVNRHLAAVRGIVKIAWLSGLMTSQNADAVAAGLKSVPVQSRSDTARIFTAGELRTVFADLADRDGVVARRDAAMLALLTGCGLRRSELAALDLDDLDGTTVTVRSGKGGKARLVFIDHGAHAAVADWVAARGEDPGPLLLTFGRGRDAGRMTGHGIWKRVNLVFVRAGVYPAAPHDCRRWMITELLSAGQDVIAVRDLAGHSSVSTTAVYDRRGVDAARRAASHLHVPYVGPG